MWDSWFSFRQLAPLLSPGPRLLCDDEEEDASLLSIPPVRRGQGQREQSTPVTALLRGTTHDSAEARVLFHYLFPQQRQRESAHSDLLQRATCPWCCNIGSARSSTWYILYSLARRITMIHKKRSFYCEITPYQRAVLRKSQENNISG